MNASSICAFSVPVKRHCAMNRFFERAVISFIVTSEIGTVTSVMIASSGEIEIIITTTPMMVSVEVSIMLKRLLEALGDVVDVVGDPAEQIAARAGCRCTRAEGG